MSFVHDLNGLHLAAQAEGPLVIVVLNNGGGRIFENLPIAESGNPDVMPYFTTPLGVDLQKAVTAFGCAHLRVESESVLRAALARAYETAGCTVIEAVVPPTSARDQSREVVRRLSESLGTKAG